MLTLEQRKALVQLARCSAMAAASGQPPPPATWPFPDPPHGGAFVSCRLHSRLRGCIGSFDHLQELASTIVEVAYAATLDPRFAAHPIRPADIHDLEIEVSVLGQLRQIKEPSSLDLGSDGILVQHPAGHGCFLPHVAVEKGWTSEQLLEHCCLDKAGLHAQAWKDPHTKLMAFTAEVFSDAKLHDSVPSPTCPQRPLQLPCPP